MKELNEALVTLGIQDFQTDDLDAVKTVVDTLQSSNIEVEEAPASDEEPAELDFEQIAADVGIDPDVEDEGEFYDVDVEAVDREDAERASEYFDVKDFEDVPVEDEEPIEESKMLTEDEIEPSENIIADLITDGNTTADDVDEAIRECCELIGESVENVDFDKIHALVEREESATKIIPNGHSPEFYYRLLDRMVQDCKYYLGAGYGFEKYLWAGSVERQMQAMREIYDILPIEPEWLTREDIDEYERKMLAVKAEQNDKRAKLEEDTVKYGSDWVNKGKEGTHGRFKTKKEADAQRKAMFASGYKGEAVNNAEVQISDSEIQKILEKIKEEYKFLYDNRDQVAGYDEAVAAYDDFIQKPEFMEFVRRLVAKRGDFFSSDREIGALMFALDSLGYLDKFEAVPLMEINEAAEAGNNVVFVEMYTKLNDGDLNGYREDLLKLSEQDKKDYVEWASNNGIPVEDLRLYMGLNETSNPDCNFGTTPNSYLKDCNATPCKMKRVHGFAANSKENEGFPLRKDDGLAPKIVAIKESAENMLATAKSDAHKQAIVRRMAGKLVSEGVSYSTAVRMLTDK